MRMIGVCVLFVGLLLQTVQPKIAKGRVSFSTFEKDNCVLLTRYGAEHGKGTLEFKYNVAGKYTSELEEYNNNRSSEIKSFLARVEILVVDDPTHKRLQDLIARKDKAVLTESWEKHLINSRDLQQTSFDVLKEATVRNSFSTSTDEIHYFYLCDMYGSLRKYHEAKTKQREAELGSDTPQVSLDFGSLQNIIKSFSWYSSVAWELKVTTSAGAYSSMSSGVESHHSVEERFTSKILLVFSLLYAGILVYLANKIRAYYRENESVDYPLLSILVTVVLMLVGALFKFVHFWVYSQTGEDVAALEVFARIWFLAGDFFLTVVLVLIARGWGVKQLGDFLSEFEIEFLVGAIILVSRYIWVLVGFFIESDTEHIYHMFDGIVGKLELVASIAAYIWFVLTMKLHNSLNQKKFENLKFQLLGYSTLFLLIRPALILTVYLFAQASQHGAALVIYLGSHCIVAGLLAVSFTNKNGVYMKISLSNALELGGNTKAT